MRRKPLCLLLAIALSIPVTAYANCLRGGVTFDTNGQTQKLELTIHERRIEVPMGLMRTTELAVGDGVLSVYPDAREDRTIRNSNLFSADLISFDTEGRVLNMLIDTTDAAVDEMSSGADLLYVAYLGGGTIQAMGFSEETVLVGWECNESE